jgi:hypothetical protein
MAINPIPLFGTARPDTPTFAPTPGVLEETGDSLTVTGPDGQPVTVAKNALNPEAVDRIKRSAATGWQRWGEGGPASPMMPSLAPAGAPPPPAAPAPAPLAQEAAGAQAVAPPPQGQPQPGTGGSGRVGTGGGASSGGFGPTQKAFAQEEAAARTQQQVADKMAEERYTQLSAQHAADQKLALEQSELETKKQEWQQRENDKYMQQKQQLDSARVDPGRFWNSRDTGQKVLAGLAAGLGGFAAGILGGRNSALDSLESAIEQDIDAQKANIGIQERGLERQERHMGRVAQQHQDAILAKRQQRLEGWDQVEREAQLLTSKHGPALNQANTEKMLADIGLKRAQAYDAFQARAAEVAHKNALLDLERQKVGIDMMQAAAKAGKTAAGRELPATEAKDLGALKSAMDALTDLQSNYQKNASSWHSGATQYLPWTTDAKKYNDSAKLAAQVVGRLYEAGKLGDADYSRYMSLMPEPSDSNERAAAKFVSLQKGLAQLYDGQVEGLAKSGFNVGGFAVEQPDLRKGSAKGAK